MSVREKGSVYEQPSVYNQGGGAPKNTGGYMPVSPDDTFRKALFVELVQQQNTHIDLSTLNVVIDKTDTLQIVGQIADDISNDNTYFFEAANVYSVVRASQGFVNISYDGFSTQFAATAGEYFNLEITKNKFNYNGHTYNINRNTDGIKYGLCLSDSSYYVNVGSKVFYIKVFKDDGTLKHCVVFGNEGSNKVAFDLVTGNKIIFTVLQDIYFGLGPIE